MVSALATILYTIGTFALWLTTWRALMDARDAFRLNLLVALHDIDDSTIEAGTAPPEFVTASENRRQRTLKLMQKVFPGEWEKLVPKQPKRS